MSFKFDLGQNVEIEVSGEVGVILARAEYVNSENTYYLRYRSVDGRAVEGWWQEGALRAHE